MSGIIIAFVLGIVLMAALVAQRERLGGGFGAWFRSKKGLVVWAAVAVIALVLVVQSLVTVQAGTVGVVKRLGAVRQELSPGLHLIVPFIDSVVIFPTLKKTYEASETPQSSEADYPDIIITALTSDGQQIRVGMTARFMIAPGKAAWIVQNLGTEREYVEKVVKTEIRGSGRRVPTRFAAYDLYTKKSYEAQQALFDEISPKFEKNGLVLDEIVIRNIIFTPEYAKTLEEKQIALENITTEKNKLEQEKIRKEQKIVEAEGDAKSIEIRQAALTKNPTIIQWEFVQKLAPNVQWGIMPDKVIPVIDFKGLTNPQK
ncbi:MAG TPA: prohibitin family protein [Candidatus Aminicenantes bacterium]|nr:prohibitin family protein [Candidatus Aminicenantes bacterium]HRY64984.1 prohibitin family protein [Candidatus Aminicenantes bacterium]HRZ71897.1 prohibitin family protein [Candidatus Aminicenantes bacterium]